MAYVDGFVIPMKKDRVEDYVRIAEASSALFKEYGALSVVGSSAADMRFARPRAVQAAEDEVVVFSWITYPSKEVRDASNKRMMEDPRMKDLMEACPVDGKRMIFGGFNIAVQA